MGAHNVQYEMENGDFTTTYRGRYIPGTGYMEGHGTALPTTEGWAPGAIFQVISASAAALYKNDGTSTTASWTAISIEGSQEDFGSGGLKTDVISESTAATGVTADGVLLKDGSVTATGSFIIGSADINETDLEQLDGLTAGTITASKAVIATSAGGVGDADLILESTNEINITIGTVSMLALDDAAISTNAGATDTAGKPCFIETQDGGAASGANNGVAGGAFNVKTGDGSIPAGAGTTGGAGGANGLVTGAGAAGSATGTGGQGGDLTLATGAGGTTSGAGTGGRGGDLILTPGVGGTTSGGTNGRNGVVNVADGKALVVGAVGVPATYGGGNFIGLEDSGTDPSSTYTNSLAMYTPDAGDSLDFLHADGTTDSLGT